MGQSTSDNHTTMYKLVIASAILATAFAAGPPAYGPPAPYKEEKLPPQPFAYEYGVADDYSKANFKKTESQDGNGVVTGSFVLLFLTAGSRPPPTPPTTPTDSSLMSPTRAPPSTPQSPRRDTDTTPPPLTSLALKQLTENYLLYLFSKYKEKS